MGADISTRNWAASRTAAPSALPPAQGSAQRIGKLIDARDGAVESQGGEIVRHRMQRLVGGAAQLQRGIGIGAAGVGLPHH